MESVFRIAFVFLLSAEPFPVVPPRGSKSAYEKRLGA